MENQLNQLIHLYLSDKPFQRLWTERIKNRDRRTPNLRIDIADFVNGRISLDSFRNSRLANDLPIQAWDSSNKKNSREWLLAELTTLTRYNTKTAEEALKRTLCDLNSVNIGQRIEFFHDFLTDEQQDFRRENRRGRPMAPLNAALMISLFASILDPTVYFCDVYLRRGLTALWLNDMITINPAISYDNETIEIRSYEDYQYIKVCLDQLLQNTPKLHVGSSWAEIFTRWIIDQVKVQ